MGGVGDLGEPEPNADDPVAGGPNGADCDRVSGTLDRDDLVPREDGGVYCEACFEKADGGKE